jgi:hypothetical protein
MVPYGQEATTRGLQTRKPLSVSQTVEVRGVVPRRKYLDNVATANDFEVDPADPTLIVTYIDLSPNLNDYVSRKELHAGLEATLRSYKFRWAIGRETSGYIDAVATAGAKLSEQAVKGLGC